MSFNFVFDRRNDVRPYPNLAPMIADPHGSYSVIGNDWPRIAPCRLLLYCDDHGYPYSVSYMDEPLPEQALYPIGLAWFDYSLDYFDLMLANTISAVRSGQLTVLFYYHEGDNPYREKARLDQLCQQHNLPVNCYRFISGNTKADCIDNFLYFADHELFYWRYGVVWDGVAQSRVDPHQQPRSRRFTLLNRTHKWWRSTITAYLKYEGILDSAYWSYGMVDIGDLYNNNPIRLALFPGLEQYMKKFLDSAPYVCDELSVDDHNRHWLLAEHLYADSYCSLITETLYDAEQSGGAFITEKTFKAILNGHPFVIFGCPNTLATLRQLGYRTFDQAIDNSYDLEQDNTERFRLTVESIKQLQKQDPHQWYMTCWDDVVYNQQHFIQSKYRRLADLNLKLVQPGK